MASFYQMESRAKLAAFAPPRSNPRELVVDEQPAGQSLIDTLGELADREADWIRVYRRFFFHDYIHHHITTGARKSASASLSRQRPRIAIHHGPLQPFRAACAQVRNPTPRVKDTGNTASMVQHSRRDPAFSPPRPPGPPAPSESRQEILQTLQPSQSHLRGGQAPMGIFQRPPLGAGEASSDS